MTDKQTYNSEVEGNALHGAVDERRSSDFSTKLVKMHIESWVNNKYLERRGLDCGNFYEQQVTPLIRQMLEEDFNADFNPTLISKDTTRRTKFWFDSWGVARDGTERLYLLQIQGQLDKEHLELLLLHVEMFHRIAPEYAVFQIHPMIVVADTSEKLRQKAWSMGIILIEVLGGRLKPTRDPLQFSQKEKMD